jgi:hypothetical protein
MPITGTFEADFSQFSSATAAATQDLKAFQSSATQATQAVSDLEKQTQTAVPHTSTLAESYSKFDGALNAVGIHIGPQIQAIKDIGAAAGQSASQIGLLGAAGLVVSTAMAAWKFGTWAGEASGLTKAISDGTATLLGWGDVANQTALAVDQSIVLAFQRTGKWARDGAEALRLNTQWANENQKAAKEASKEHKAWADSLEELDAAGQGWRGTLMTIDGETVEAIKYYLDAGVSQGKLATAYALTDVQVKAVASSMAAQKKSTEDAAKAADEGAKAAERYAQAWERSQKQTAELWAKQGEAFADYQKTETQLEDTAARARLDHDLAFWKTRHDQGLTSTTLYNAEVSALNRTYAAEHESALASELASRLEKMRQAQEGEIAVVAERYNKGTIDEATYQEQLEAIRSRYRLQEQGAQDTADTQAAIRRQQRLDAEIQAATSAAKATIAAISSVDAFMNANQRVSLSQQIPAADITDANRASSIARLKQLEDLFKQYPGRAPGGTGKTGLASDDMSGYMEMLRERIEYASLKQALPGLAAGGPVSAGRAYVVGERGPELFLPGMSGAISPNAPGAGGASIQIVIQGSVLSTRAELAELVGQAFVSAYRSGGNRLPV